MTEKEGRYRITVYVPPSLRAEITASAEKAGQTLSVWIERSCRATLDRAPQNETTIAKVAS